MELWNTRSWLIHPSGPTPRAGAVDRYGPRRYWRLVEWSRTRYTYNHSQCLLSVIWFSSVSVLVEAPSWCLCPWPRRFGRGVVSRRQPALLGAVVQQCISIPIAAALNGTYSQMYFRPASHGVCHLTDWAGPSTPLCRNASCRQAPSSFLGGISHCHCVYSYPLPVHRIVTASRGTSLC